MLFTGLNCTPVETLDRRVLVDPILHGFSPPIGQLAHFDSSIPEPNIDVEVRIYHGHTKPSANQQFIMLQPRISSLDSLLNKCSWQSNIELYKCMIIYKKENIQKATAL